jgi:hypothetical protein
MLLPLDGQSYQPLKVIPHFRNHSLRPEEVETIFLNTVVAEFPFVVALSMSISMRSFSKSSSGFDHDTPSKVGATQNRNWERTVCQFKGQSSMGNNTSRTQRKETNT